MPDCPRCQPVSVRPKFHRRIDGPPEPGRPRRCGHPRRSIQDARRLMWTHLFLPTRPFMWLESPPVGRRSKGTRAAWTMPAKQSHRSPPSRRHCYEEIPTKRCFISCCPQHSYRNRRTPGQSTITPRSKTGCERDWAKLVRRCILTPEARQHASRSPFSRTSWSVWSPSDLHRRRTRLRSSGEPAACSRLRHQRDLRRPRLRRAKHTPTIAVA